MSPPDPVALSALRPFRDEGLIALTTRRPVAVTMIVLTVVIFGVISFEQLPRNLMPDISYPTITVRTEYPGASPADVEMRISRRLEEVLSQVRNLRRISSISRAEISDVILEFAWNTPMSLATPDVREKVDQAILPNGIAKPTVLRYDPTLDPVLQIGLLRRGGSGRVDVADLIELRIQAEDVIERELEKMEGVAAVQVRGGYERELRIEVAEAQLKARGLSMALINQRLKEENLNQASGQLYDGDQAYVVRTVNEFQDIDEVREIILRRDGEVPVRLREVAQVTWSHAEPEVLTRVDGNPCVKIEIFKEADANIVEVARRVREKLFGTPAEQRRLAEMEARERALAAGDPRALAEREREREAQRRAHEAAKSQGGGKGKGGGPAGAPAEAARPNFVAAGLAVDEDLVVMSDQSVFIQTALDDVRSTAITGGILTILVLFIFLKNAWFTLAVSLSIPVSVVATFVVMHATDVSLNLMSLGGLAMGIGLVVDNSIVVLESIFRCREEGDAPRVAAVRGTQQVSGAVVASTLTTVAVFFPIVFVEGIAGQIFRDQAMTVVISLFASLAVALYLIPACVGRVSSGLLAVSQANAAANPSWSGIVDELRERQRRLRWTLWNAVFLAFFVLFAWVSCLLQLTLGLLGWSLAWLLKGCLRGVQFLTRALARRSGGLLTALSTAWDALFARALALYEKVLLFSLAHRAVVLAVTLVTVGLSAWFFAQLGTELIPEVHQGEFTINVRLPVGTRLERTDQILRPIEARLRQAATVEGVESVTSTLGVEKDSIKAGDEGEHTARILVRLKRGVALGVVEERVKASFREVLAGAAELSSYKFETPVLFSFKTPIEVEVKGHNLEDLRRVAGDIEEQLRSIPSLKDLKSSAATGFPEVHLRLDREVLARYGLNVAAVGDVIRQKIQGEVPTYFNEGDRRIGLRSRLLEEDRKSLEDLSRLIINPGAAVPLRLSDIVVDNAIEVSEGPAEIRRIGQQRAAVVTANVAGVDLGGTTRAVEAVIEQVPRPPSFLVGFGGQKEEMDQSLASLIQALLLAIFLVYVVMAIQFESLLQPLVILVSVPLTVVGISPVLWLCGMSLSIVVLIGMIILAGIVVNNAIVLLDQVNYLRAQGKSVRDALVGAGKVRMRPILMTSLTTILGLLPMTGVFSPLTAFVGDVPVLRDVFGTGEGAEIRAPLAVTVMCGLSAATALTLIVIPVVYSVVARLDRRRGPMPVEATHDA